MFTSHVNNQYMKGESSQFYVAMKMKDVHIYTYSTKRKFQEVSFISENANNARILIEIGISL